jgi:diguanylate cyclase (GGDEF)-like protein/PAS domain S-box-containing protein
MRVATLLRGWSRDWGGLLVLALSAHVLLFLAWLLVRWPFGEHVVLIDNVAFVPMSLAGSVLAWRAASRRSFDPRTRRAWLVIGFASFAFWAGDVLWLYYENILGEAPFPSWADAGYLLYYPLLLLGLLLFPMAPRGGGQVLKFWLDSHTVLLGGGMVIWYLLLRPIAQAEDSSALLTTLSLAYPVGDLVLLFGIANVVLRQPLMTSSRALTVLALGVLTFVIADVAFGYMSIQGLYSTGDWPDAVWIFGQLLMVIAAQYQCWNAPRERADEHSGATPGLGFSLLSPVAVIMSFGLLLIAARGELEAPVGGLIIAAVALTTVVLVRQLTSLAENTRLLLRATTLADELRRSEARFRSLVQNASDVIIVVDANANIVYESPAVERVLGYSPHDRLGQNALATVHPEEGERVSEVLGYVARNPGEFRTLEFRVRHANGAWRWIEVTVSNLLDDSSVNGIVGNYRDITERKMLEKQLAHQASHDALTGLANRTLFRDRLQHALARGARHGEPVSVLFLDIDDFKTVNDSLGHSAGDELLVTVAARLKSSLRQSDIAGRFGGDEFAVLLEDTAGPAAEITAERILRTLAEPIHLQGMQLLAQASIGISSAENGAATQEELLRTADVAMYAAKGQGKARYAVVESDGSIRVGPRSATAAAG